MLNIVWLLFFVLAFLASLYQWAFEGRSDVFELVVQSIFEMSKVAVTISIGLIGLMCFWLGILRIAEKAGIVASLAKFLNPLFHRLMPEVPPDHPAFGSISMNLVANFLGLGNAATPLGLKAMQDLQLVNPYEDKTVASNAQILFLVLNTSSVTLIPATIFFLRAQQGSTEPTSVFIPILLATSASSLIGLLIVAFVQRLRLWDPVIFAYLGTFALGIGAFIVYLQGLSAEALQEQSKLLGNLVLFSFIIVFLLIGWARGIRVYEAFVEGAKEGFEVAVRIIPFLVAMLVAIGVFRASGVMEAGLDGLRWAVSSQLGWDPAFIDGLPTAFMRPFSGSGAQTMMINTFQVHGVDSFAGKLASIIQGSTETTFYILAVYFGSVGIRKTRHAIACGLLSDAAGILVAILVAYWFFG